MSHDEHICPYWCQSKHGYALDLVHHGTEVPIPAVLHDTPGLRATTLGMSLRADHMGCWVVIDEPGLSPLAVADLSTMNRIAKAWEWIRPDAGSRFWSV